MREPASRAFYELAAGHGGYFTTREASGAGLSYRQLSYHATSGELERVMHGVYRLVNYPAHRHGDMIAATLWAGPGSAISHDSAVAVYELASVMPAVIHLTAPGSFTGSRSGIRIHHEDLASAERRLWDDVPVTTIERTLIDLARTGDASLVREAARESVERGLSTPARLATAVSREPDRAQLRQALGVRLPLAKEPA
jgi:predicted transcriptional regulator of viral defense system